MQRSGLNILCLMGGTDWQRRTRGPYYPHPPQRMGESGKLQAASAVLRSLLWAGL